MTRLMKKNYNLFDPGHLADVKAHPPGNFRPENCSIPCLQFGIQQCEYLRSHHPAVHFMACLGCSFILL